MEAPMLPRQRRRNTVPSAAKGMSSVIWGYMEDYLQKGQTINGINYASLLIQFREYIKLKSRRRLEHPPYSPDFALSEFHLIPRLKKMPYPVPTFGQMMRPYFT